MYYYYHRWYDPSIGRFISPDPQAGQGSNPQSLNPYVYALGSPPNYFDQDGASPINIVLRALIVLGGMYSMGSVLDIRFRYGPVHFQTLPTPYEGDTYHTLFTVYKPKIPGERGTEPLFKLDRPSSGAGWDVEQGYHYRIGEATPRPFPDSLGGIADWALFHADRGLLIVGLGFSAYRIWSAYQSDVASGDGYGNTIRVTEEEVFSWGGATAGCYLGATLGSVVPGAGTAVGCFVGGVFGGIYGVQALDAFAGPHWSYPGTDPPMGILSPHGRMRFL